MTRSFKRSLFGVVALFAGLLAGCERVSDINNVEPPRYAIDGSYKLLQPNDSSAPTTQTTTAEVRSNESATISIGKYALHIPAGSVRKPTTFRMTVTTGDVVKVDLHAHENNGRVVSQFPNGLRLTLPYDYANVSDPSKLVVAYIVPNGDGSYRVVEAVQSAADTNNQTVTGTIYHFSAYTLADHTIYID